MNARRLPDLVGEEDRGHRWRAMAGTIVAVVTGISLATGSDTSWITWVVFVAMTLVALNAYWNLVKLRRARPGQAATARRGGA